MRHPITEWRDIFLVAAGILLAAAAIFLRLLRRPADPEEIERQRRLYLNRVGRIVEGRITEIVEQAREEPGGRRRLFSRRGRAPQASGNGTQKLLFYTYSISGVTYETAQDITGLEERACLDRLVTGQPASVKYDPSNPSNSILVGDDWSGLQ